MNNNQLIINGHEFFAKAFNGLPDMVNTEGEHIGAVLGFFYLLFNEISENKPESVSVLWDDTENEVPDAFGSKSQALLIKELLDTMQLSKTEGSIDLKEVLSEASMSIINTHELKKIAEFAGGEGASPSKKTEIVITSDFNETENIFTEAVKYASGKNDRIVAFYPAQDKACGSGLIGLSVCFEETKAYFIKCEGFITADYLAGKLQALSDSCRLSTFDIKKSYYLFTPKDIENFDKKDYGNIDILIGAYLLNPLKNDYMPENIADEYLSIKLKSYGDTFGKALLKDSDENLVAAYAGNIASISFLTAPIIEKKLKKEEMLSLMNDIEMPLSFILYDMEKNGIIAKREQLKDYSDNLAGRIEVLEKKIHEEAGVEFNINSPKQLGEVLFEKLGLPGGKKTKSGYSTAADVLEKLAPEHKIVKDVLEYRGLAKLKSTYADGLSEYIEEDGRIHTSFNQTITATGRISSTEPNLQNIPMRTEEGRSIRKVFVPKDGYVFADADYSQIELRILAHMSGDKGLIEAYHEGKDIHRITASKVFNTPFEEVTDLQRRNAKAVNFGIVYGMSTFGLSEDLSISRAEAKEYMEQYFATYPGVQQYQERAITEAKEKGYAVTIYGRRRPMPELKSGNYMVRQFGERVAMNAPIQGTAADIMKIAMINVWRRLKKDGLKSELILQIHDELVIETAPDEVDAVKNLLEQEMMGAADLLVPLEVECHTGKDWYEAK